MEYKELIDYARWEPKPRRICWVSVGIVVLAVVLTGALLYGLHMRGVPL